jgi:hypothetical protein
MRNHGRRCAVALVVTIAACGPTTPGVTETMAVVLVNSEEHDVDTTAGDLWRAAST